jgi:hypothetical protein
MEEKELQQTLNSSVETVHNLPFHSRDIIESTAKRLEDYRYSPILLIPVDNFIRLTREELIDEMKRTVDLSEAEMRDLGFTDGADLTTKKDQQLNLLVHHFSLLSRLRNDEPEAWDEVEELYEDD